MNDSQISVTIAPATAQNTVAALQLVLANQPPAQQTANLAAILAAQREGQLSLAGLFTAIRTGQVTAAAWCQTMPGKTCIYWPPQLASGETEATADALLAATHQFLTQKQIVLAQAMLPLDHGPEAERLLRGGFQHALDLLYLAAPREKFPTSPPQSPLTYEAYRESQAARLQSVIARTYLGSLDCVRLEGARNVADVIEGYRHSGEYRPERWFFVRHQDRDVGCLILTDHPADRQWELVYVGLVPEARGRGWGLEITRWAQFQAQQANPLRLVLAVDSENPPALHMYAAAGFETWDRRSVFLLRLTKPS